VTRLPERLQVADPWSERALALTGCGVLGGLVLLAIGWLGASGAATFSRQIAWVNVAVLGAALAAAAQASWLIAGWRAVGVQRTAFLATVSWPQLADAPTAGAGEIVTVPGTRRYHRPECLLVRGKATIAVGDRNELEPCELCHPGEPDGKDVQ
jgi:hypothetical protein